MKSILRKFRLKLGKWLLDKKIQGEPLPQNPKILVLQQDGKIGDYIVSSFIFRELKKFNPNLQVDVLCSPKNLNLFQENKFVDRCFVLERKKICSYTKMGMKLSKENYDVLINLPVLLRNRDLWLTRLINAKNNIGYKKENYHLFNFNVSDSGYHFSQVYAEAIKLIGVDFADLTYDIPFQSHQKEEIACFVQQNKLHNAVAINFFGAASSRKFSETKIHEFLRYMKNENKTVLLLTYPEVTAKLSHIAKAYENVFIYQDTKSIFDTIELLRYVKTVISPDTSIIHIAAGLNKEIIGFYKLSDEENYKHWHPNNKNKTHILDFSESVDEILAESIVRDWLE